VSTKPVTSFAANILVLAHCLRAGGADVPHTLSELNHWYLEPPAGQNAATFFVQGFECLSLSDREFNSPNLPWLGHEQPPPITDKPIPAAMNKAMGQFVQRQVSAMRYFAQAARCEQSRYPIDLSRGGQEPLPHLTKVRQANISLAIAVLLWANAHEGKRAGDALLMNLCLIRSLEPEPLLVSQQIRGRCTVLAVQTLEQLLNRSSLPARTREQLQTNFLQLGDRTAAGTAFSRGAIGDWVMLDDMSTWPTEKLLGFFRSSSEELSVEETALAVSKYPGAEDRQLLRDTFRQIIEDLKQPYPNRLQAVRDLCTIREVVATNKHLLMTALVSRRVLKAMEEEAHCAALLRMAQTAIALDQYRYAHSDQYPENLETLRPAYLAGVPLDPFNGQPLKYDPQGRGYMLSSAGPASSSKPNSGTVTEHLTFSVVTPQ
jgi:hypothetical protein